MTDGCEYVELHAASAFSFLAGASQPEDLLNARRNLTGPPSRLPTATPLWCARFLKAQSMASKPHRRGDRRSLHGNQTQPPAGCRINTRASRRALLLLCASQTGYQIFASSSHVSRCTRLKRPKSSHTRRHRRVLCRIDLSYGGDAGPIAAAVAHGGHKGASNLIDRLSCIFGYGNLYLELQRHTTG